MENKFLSSFFRITDETYALVFIACLISTMIIIPKCIHSSFKKLNSLKDSELNNSYSVISDYMLKCMIFSLAF